MGQVRVEAPLDGACRELQAVSPHGHRDGRDVGAGGHGRSGEPVDLALPVEVELLAQGSFLVVGKFPATLRRMRLAEPLADRDRLARAGAGNIWCSETC